MECERPTTALDLAPSPKYMTSATTIRPNIIDTANSKTRLRRWSWQPRDESFALLVIATWRWPLAWSLIQSSSPSRPQPGSGMEIPGNARGPYDTSRGVDAELLGFLTRDGGRLTQDPMRLEALHVDRQRSCGQSAASVEAGLVPRHCSQEG